MYREITLLAVGDVLSKKKELLVKYTWNKRLYEHCMPSTFVENVREIVVDYIPYSVHFVDVECDDDYEILRWNNYEKADVILLCYSIAVRKTFESIVKKWCVEVRKARPNIPVILVGTDTEARSLKILSRRQFVTTDEGEDLKYAINACAFVECSVDKCVGIDDVFIEAIRSTYCNTSDYNAFYHSKKNDVKQKKCCL